MSAFGTIRERSSCCNCCFWCHIYFERLRKEDGRKLSHVVKASLVAVPTAQEHTYNVCTTLALCESLSLASSWCLNKYEHEFNAFQCLRSASNMRGLNG